MTIADRNILLIWPPYVTPRWFPMGISFLAAYLKDKGQGPVDVFDMNSVYLKEIQPLWGLNAILKRGCQIARKNFLAENFQDYLFEKKDEVLVHMIELGMRSIPWSLRAIMDSLTEDAAVVARKKVSRMMGPIMRGGKYSLIGISVNYPEQLFFSLLVAQHLKKTLGVSAKIVFGGAQVTKHIDFLKKDPRVFEVVDYFVTADGEEALSRLCRLEARADPESIPNLYYKPEDGSKVFIASKAHFTFEPENFLVPDFSGFDSRNYEAMVPLIITKGCYWSRCAFCTFRHGDGRHFSIGSVGKAMSLLKGVTERTGSREFFFVDDALPPPFMNELASALVHEQAGVSWSANIILDKAFGDPAFCRRLKESGLDIVNIGLESVSGRVLRLMNKFHQEMSESEMEVILKTLKTAGIKIQLNIIFGFPTETLEEARRTLAFLVKNAGLYDFAPMQPFSLEDHTLVADDPARFGIIHIYKEDKNSGRRLGYRYDVSEGMTQGQTVRFLQEEALVNVRAALKDKKRPKK